MFLLESSSLESRFGNRSAWKRSVWIGDKRSEKSSGVNGGTKMKARMRYRNNCAATTISALLSKFLAIVTMRNDKTVARRGGEEGGLVWRMHAPIQRDPFHARITSIFFHAPREFYACRTRRETQHNTTHRTLCINDKSYRVARPNDFSSSLRKDRPVVTRSATSKVQSRAGDCCSTMKTRKGEK